jgi:hypothetical protein
MKNFLEEIYKLIIEPKNIRNQFKNEKDFKDWLKTGTKKDLECTFKVFKNAKMHEDCIIIKNEINLK